MSKPVFSKEALLDWARSKNPKEEYTPSSGLHCALAKYGRFLGIEYPCGGTREIWEMNKDCSTTLKCHKIEGIDGKDIYYKSYTGKGENEYRLVNNFGNLVEALERTSSTITDTIAPAVV